MTRLPPSRPRARSPTSTRLPRGSPAFLASSSSAPISPTISPTLTRLSAGYKRVFAEGSVVDYPLAIRHADGHTTDVLYNATLYRNEAGEVAGIFAAARDITDQKRTQDRLKRSEESLQEAQRLALLGNWELDLAENALTWSAEIYRIFEIDPQRFGASYEAFLDAIHPDDRAAVDAAYTTSVRNRTPYEITHRLLMPDGRIKHVHERCRTYYDGKGDPIRSVGTVQDITARTVGEHQRRHAEETAQENARLYAEQQRIATVLQENFIHPLPVVAGLELGVVSQPAYAPELVGGDLSDVFVVDESHVVVLIADVAGKGVQAAGMTETVRSTVRALATIDCSPAFILAKANELLLRFDPDEPHVTAFLAVLDPNTGHLSYASAGHPAPIHLGGFSCQPLDVAFGPPLGSFEHAFANAHTMLTLEGYLVLYTDGVTEARRGANCSVRSA